MRCCWLPLLLGLMTLQARAADAFVLDGSHTRVAFDVRNLGVPWIEARFRQLAGRFVVDRRGADSRIEVTVRTDSIEGLAPFWDQRLRSPGWLDTQRYPEMTYRSSHVAFKDDGGAVADGQLTLHGVTRPVTLNVKQLNCPVAEDVRRGCAFSAYAKLRRSDFGLPHGFWAAGDAVEISVSGTAGP
jgi:polyisoprenoid-binding protein YceI